MLVTLPGAMVLAYGVHHDVVDAALTALGMAPGTPWVSLLAPDDLVQLRRDFAPKKVSASLTWSGVLMQASVSQYTTVTFEAKATKINEAYVQSVTV